MKYNIHSREKKITLVREYMSKGGNKSKFCRERGLNLGTFESWVRKFGNDEAKENKLILVISDMHIPYHHQDSFAFLRALKKKYNFTRIINIGDEVDNHGISFHDSDPDLLSAGDELKASQAACAELQGIFPIMDLVHSNHGSLSYRRGKAGGIPRHFLRDYNDVLLVDDGWQWHDEIILESGLTSIIFRHQFSANVLKAAEQMGMSCVQGHYHSKFVIEYTSSPLALNWGMTVGCLIDPEALAFEYNKLQTKRPIIGVGIIDNGMPRLIPMLLGGDGRWTGVVP